MGSLLVRLLGRPQLERDGEILAGPRGRKAWAVLAHVALSERPATRERLAGLLFSDAADPLGALRWTLAELRRTLGVPDVLRGDPPALDLPPDSHVDALLLLGDDPHPSLVRGELLEGTEPMGDTVFGAWLLVERRRLAGQAEGVLHDAALAALARGDAVAATDFARRALALSEYNETLHELLVRCLRATGDVSAARRHARACEELFQRELGRRPDARVRRAADDEAAHVPALGDRAAALAQLEAGKAALDAGAVEPGIACLRLACAEARACGEPLTLARTLVTLGAALVHAVRGRDEEGAALLHEALRLAEEAGDRASTVEACREIGYVEAHAGRGTTAGRWLHRATALAQGDHERAAILGVRGMALSDRAHYAPAADLLRQSVAAAERCGDVRAAAWSLAALGRVLLLRDELAAAADVLDRSLSLVAAERLVAVQPFPEAMQAEVLLRSGRAGAAAELADHAYSLGCRLGDPCWEGLAARARGLVHATRGEADRALDCHRDAAERARRVPDRYAWAEAQCLDAFAGELIRHGAFAEAAEVVERLERLAARGDMRELVVRGQLHAARIGGRAAAASARLLAEAIDNPRLQPELDAV